MNGRHIWHAASFRALRRHAQLHDDKRQRVGACSTGRRRNTSASDEFVPDRHLGEFEVPGRYIAPSLPSGTRPQTRTECRYGDEHGPWILGPCSSTAACGGENTPHALSQAKMTERTISLLSAYCDNNPPAWSPDSPISGGRQGSAAGSTHARTADRRPSGVMDFVGTESCLTISPKDEDTLHVV